jgi:hypothetical protein
VGNVAGYQLLALLLAGLASASAEREATFRRNPAPATLADCLIKQVPGFNTGSKVPIQALKNCAAQVRKREIGAGQLEDDVASYTIDGGHPNIIVT